MSSDQYPNDDMSSPPDPDVGVRLEAATTLIPGEEESELPVSNAGGEEVAAAPSPAPSPPLRIILALRPCPREGGTVPTYDVTISADHGKDADCDPYWRSFAGLDLHSALDKAAEVVAAAEEQWRANPRYPRVAPQPANGGKGRATPQARRTPAAPTAVLPPFAATSATAPSEPTARPVVPVPTPHIAGVSAESEHAAEAVGIVASVASGPPLLSGKPKPCAGKPGDRKQLSLFG